MTTRARMALLVAGIVIAVVAFIVLKPGDTKKDNAASTQTTTVAGGSSKPAPPPVTQVNVKGGKPVGGIKKFVVNKGDQVRFVVNSDVTDEIHVHGYNFHKSVKAGGKVSFSFPAKIDGVFVIELEHRGQQIAELTVNP
jgi:heme/copper-type cytochrome/quinol oxidase subunit 2